MMLELREHDKDYCPPSITEDYWIIDLKNYLVPADCKPHPFKTHVHGYGIEIHMEGQWPIIVQFQFGRIQLGNYVLQVDCLERAVEDLRYIISITPKYAAEYKEAMKNAAVEMQKDKMIKEIYEATVAPTLQPILEGRGLSCSTKRNFKSVTLALVDNKLRMKTFYITYDNFENELEGIKTYIESNYPPLLAR